MWVCPKFVHISKLLYNVSNPTHCNECDTIYVTLQCLYTPVICEFHLLHVYLVHLN